ncbi:hypothetical protein ACFE04_030864 [Oxalis oulophora]
MATSFTFLLISSILLLSSSIALSATAPAPSPSAAINITAILEKGGQFTTFIRLLNQTQVATQINTQVESSSEGMTVFAPTDNAFNNLKAGTLNDLSDNEQVQLVLYHVSPKYYTIKSLLTVSNPVRTQASGQEGGVWGLNFTGEGSQVNVSSGVVVTQVNNALRDQSPLAVYQVDQVLLPEELFGEKKITSTEAPSKAPTAKSSPAKSDTTADAPSGSGKREVGIVGLVVGFGLACMSLLS